MVSATVVDNFSVMEDIRDMAEQRLEVVDSAPPKTDAGHPHRKDTMTVTAILELQFRPEKLDEAREILARALPQTRAFEGSEGVDVLVDRADETRWLVYERWASMEHDAAYRAHRAGEGRIVGLPETLAVSPTLRWFDNPEQA